MSKVLVDRELLEQTVKHLEWDGDGSQTVMQYAQQGDRLAEELAEAIAQPAEAGRPGDWEWLKLMAEVAEQDRPWDPRLGMTDVEMAYAQSASPSKVLELIAALSSVTAERDRIENELEETELRALKFFHRFSAATDLGRELREALELIEKSADGEQCRQIAYDALEPFRARAAMAAKEA